MAPNKLKMTGSVLIDPPQTHKAIGHTGCWLCNIFITSSTMEWISVCLFMRYQLYCFSVHTQTYICAHTLCQGVRGIPTKLHVRTTGDLRMLTNLGGLSITVNPPHLDTYTNGHTHIWPLNHQGLMTMLISGNCCVYSCGYQFSLWHSLTVTQHELSTHNTVSVKILIFLCIIFIHICVIETHWIMRSVLTLLWQEWSIHLWKRLLWLD